MSRTTFTFTRETESMSGTVTISAELTELYPDEEELAALIAVRELRSLADSLANTERS